MTRDTIGMLCACYAPSPDCVWAWLRAMHEQGFELRGSTICDVVFYTPDQCIIPAAKEGAPVWIPMRSQPGSRDVLYQAVKRSRLHFPDPVAAAIWWGVERTNGAPAVEPLAPEQSIAGMPPWTLPPPLPQMQPPFPPPWVEVLTNPPPPPPWVSITEASVSIQAHNGAVKAGKAGPTA